MRRICPDADPEKAAFLLVAVNGGINGQDYPTAHVRPLLPASVYVTYTLLHIPVLANLDTQYAEAIAYPRPHLLQH